MIEGGRHSLLPRFRRRSAAAAAIALAWFAAYAERPRAQSLKPAELNLTLRDHNFKLSAPVEGGPLTWRVRNDGTEPHQALVIQLPDGVNEYAERSWLTNGSRGPAPGTQVGGVELLAPGKQASFTTNLTPGRYLLLCAKREDEGYHFDLGMIYRFTIE